MSGRPATKRMLERRLPNVLTPTFPLQMQPLLLDELALVLLMHSVATINKQHSLRSRIERQHIFHIYESRL